MALKFLAASKPRDVNMQYGRVAVVQRSEATLDRWCEIIWLGDALAMRAECLGDCREIPPFPLTARGQSRLKLIGLGGNALGGYTRCTADFTACQPPLSTTTVRIGIRYC